MIFKIIKNNYQILLVLLVALVLLSININKPFIGHHDWNGAFWGAKIKPYVEYIRIRMGIEPKSDLNTNLKNSSFFSTDYTPFLPLIFTFFSLIFGVSEFSLRFSSVVFSLIMLFFIYKIGELLFSKFVGILASILAAVTPMFLYFGKLPDHEPIVTSLITIAFFAFLKSLKEKKWNFLFFLFLTLSLLESWPAFFLIPPLVIFLLFSKKQDLSKKIMPILISVAVIIFHLVLLIFTTGFSSLRGFLIQGLARMNLVSNDPGLSKVTFYTFITTEAHYAAVYFTNVLLFLLLIWFITFLVKFAKGKIKISDWALIVLFVYPLTFILTFRQLAFIHDYKLYHFLPFISLASAAFLYEMLKTIKHFLKKSKVTVNFKYINVVFLFIIVLSVFFERMKFLNTLQKTSFNTPGYELGLLIKKKTSPEDVVLINSRQFKAFFEVFVTYYSDRNVEYQSISLGNFKSQKRNYNKFKYIILVDGRTEDPRIENYLKDSYSVSRVGSYEFFDLSKEKVD